MRTDVVSRRRIIRFLAPALFVALLLLSPIARRDAGGATPLHLHTWGDSLTSGSDWQTHLVELGYDWTWTDHALPGQDSWDSACGLNLQSTCAFREWLAAHGPALPGEVVTMMWGTNDVRKPTWRTQLRAVTRAAIEQMVAEAKAANFPVAVVTPPPFVSGKVKIDVCDMPCDLPEARILSTELYRSTHSDSEVALYNANLDLLREDVSHLGDAKSYFQSLPGWPTLHYYYVTIRADGIHVGVDTPYNGKHWEGTPSGFGGRHHLAEVMASAVLAATAPRVPSLEPAAVVVLCGLLPLSGALSGIRRRR